MGGWVDDGWIGEMVDDSIDGILCFVVYSRGLRVAKDCPMPWYGSNSRGHPRHVHCRVMSCQAVCRLHELGREQVWNIRMLFILYILSEVVISPFRFTNVEWT